MGVGWQHCSISQEVVSSISFLKHFGSWILNIGNFKVKVCICHIFFLVTLDIRISNGREKEIHLSAEGLHQHVELVLFDCNHGYLPRGLM